MKYSVMLNLAKEKAANNIGPMRFSFGMLSANAGNTRSYTLRIYIRIRITML